MFGNYHLIISILSSIIFAISLVWYLNDIRKGRVTVSIATFVVLSIVTGSQLLALISEGLYYQVPFSCLTFMANLAICVFALRQKRYEFRRLDKIVLAGALFGIAVWLITKQAEYNIYILSVVVLVSIFPLIKKTFKKPESETRLPWVLNLLASILLVMTVTSLQPVAWLVPVRQLLFATLMNIALRNEPLTRKSNKIRYY